MSKYKLIKKYPCLPDSWYVGIIVTKKYDSVYSTDTSGVTCVNLCKEQVENYPEFWEKVVEKDYEILSFISNLTGSINIKTENGIDIYEGDIIHWVNTYDYNYLYPLPFSTKAVELLNADSIYKVFSSRELAEDWLIFNKPCLSIKEITLAIGEKWVSDILEKVVKNKI